jgi:hypothetical protein
VGLEYRSGRILTFECAQLTAKKVGFKSIIIQPFDWLHPSTPRYMINIVSKLGFMIDWIPLLRDFSGLLLIYGRRPLN